MSTDPEEYREDERFRKEERLRERVEFVRTRREGVRVASRHFVVYARANDRPHARIGITASTDVGPANVRNWWKRRIREIFRRNKRAFAAGLDYVVIVKPSAEKAPTDELREELIGRFEAAATRVSE